MRRHELSDEEWARLEPLLPARETRGRYYRDHRLILNGMLYWLHTGVPWRDLPPRFGPWQTVYSRFRRWSRTGVWDRILATLQRDLDAAGRIEWQLWCIDGSNVRAHKAAAGAAAGKKSGPGRAVRSRVGPFPRRLGQQNSPAH
jgi:transposase